MGDKSISLLRIANAGPSVSDKKENAVRLDALPYFDPFPEDYENYALSLIDREMKADERKGSAKFDEKKALAHLTPFDPTEGPKHLGPLMRQEYEALVARKGQERPPSDQISSILANERQMLIDGNDSESADEEGWKARLNQAKVEYESERSRQINLELQQHYESGQWRLHLGYLQQQTDLAKERSDGLKRKVDEINAARKSKQESSNDIIEIQRKTDKCRKLIYSNIRLVNATQGLKNDVQRFKEQTQKTRASKKEKLDD